LPASAPPVRIPVTLMDLSVPAFLSPKAADAKLRVTSSPASAVPAMVTFAAVLPSYTLSLPVAPIASVAGVMLANALVLPFAR